MYRTLEIRDADEIAYALKVELEPPVEHLSASSSANITHARPARPGKRASTVAKKFVADE